MFFVSADEQLTAAAFSPTTSTVAATTSTGAVLTYRCAFCGRTKQLVPLARKRLAELGRRR
jgi:hypothetical protein